MPTVESVLANVGDRQFGGLVDPSISKLASLTSEGGFSAQDKIEMVVGLRGRVGLLRDKGSRAILTDSMRKEQANSLCEYLGLERGDPWDTLRNAKIRKNSKREGWLFEWFMITDEDLPVENEIELEESVKVVSGSYSLFSHQRRAIRRVGEFLDSQQPRAFLHMPTGSGKTRTAMSYVCDILSGEESCLVIWFAYNGELCEQAAKEFEKSWGHLGNRDVEVQRMWGDYSVDEATGDGILIVGLDKLWARLQNDQVWLANLRHRVGLVVFDEAHQSTAPIYRLMIDTLLLNDECRLLGLSATPGRTYSDIEKDEELSELYFRQKASLDVEGYDSPLEFLVSGGYLSDPEFHQMTPPHEDLTNDDVSRLSESGEYSKEVLVRLSENEERNLLILDKVRDLIAGGHRRILVFATNVKHSDLLSAFLGMKWGVRCASITSQTPPDRRRMWLDRFLDEEDEGVCVLFNYGVLTTGFDAPMTSAAVIARPTTSLVLYSQMVGRVIRGEQVGGTAEAEIWTVVDQSLPGFRDLSEAFWNWEDVW